MVVQYLHGGGVVQEGEGQPGERPTGHHVIWGHGYMPACLQRLALSLAQSTPLQHRLSPRARSRLFDCQLPNSSSGLVVLARSFKNTLL